MAGRKIPRGSWGGRIRVLTPEGNDISFDGVFGEKVGKLAGLLTVVCAFGKEAELEAVLDQTHASIASGLRDALKAD